MKPAAPIRTKQIIKNKDKRKLTRNKKYAKPGT